MNKKKLLMFGLPLLCLVIVSAAIISIYYSEQITINVSQAITATGEGTQTISCVAGGSSLGSIIEVKNIAAEGIEIKIESEQVPDDCVITTEYVSKLELNQKDSGWFIIPNTTINLYYTLVGDEFVYKVDTELENYVVIYYPDIDGNPGAWNIEAAIEIGDASTEWETSSLSESLPILTDWNDAGKLWIIPKADWEVQSWNPTEWYFEDNLIKYFKNSDGIFTVDKNSLLNIYPKFNCAIDCADGSYIVNTTISP